MVDPMEMMKEAEQPASFVGRIGSFLWTSVKWLAGIALTVLTLGTVVHYSDTVRNGLDKITGGEGKGLGTKINQGMGKAAEAAKNGLNKISGDAKLGDKADGGLVDFEKWVKSLFAKTESAAEREERISAELTASAREGDLKKHKLTTAGAGVGAGAVVVGNGGSKIAQGYRYLTAPGVMMDGKWVPTPPAAASTAPAATANVTAAAPAAAPAATTQAPQTVSRLGGFMREQWGSATAWTAEKLSHAITTIKGAKYVVPFLEQGGKAATTLAPLAPYAKGAFKAAGPVGAVAGVGFDGYQAKKLFDEGKTGAGAQQTVNATSNLGYLAGLPGIAIAETVQAANYGLRYAFTNDGSEDQLSKGIIGGAVYKAGEKVGNSVFGANAAEKEGKNIDARIEEMKNVQERTKEEFTKLSETQQKQVQELRLEAKKMSLLDAIAQYNNMAPATPAAQSGDRTQTAQK